MKRNECKRTRTFSNSSEIEVIIYEKRNKSQKHGFSFFCKRKFDQLNTERRETLCYIDKVCGREGEEEEVKD